MYTRQIKESDEYDSLERTIQILITDFEIKGLEELEYCTKWKIIEDNERKQILTEKFEIDIIQMPKIKEDSSNDKLLDWLYFIENPKSERVIEKMQENEELKEAGDKLDNLSDDEMMQRIADLREKAIRDEKACYNTAYSEGIEQGIEQNQKDIVIEMLKNNMDIDTIIKITKMDKAKIEEIKKDLNIK